jgi:hypothetical protein
MWIVNASIQDRSEHTYSVKSFIVDIVLEQALSLLLVV